MSGIKNTLNDLSDLLFEQIERLNDYDLKGEELKEELNRVNAISGVAKTIIENGNLVLKAAKFQDETRTTLPRMIAGKEEEREK